MVTMLCKAAEACLTSELRSEVPREVSTVSVLEAVPKNGSG